MAEINFNEAFEKHLGEIGAEVERQKENPEARGLEEREIIRRAVESVSRPQEEGTQNNVPVGTGNLPSYLAAKKSDVAAQEEVNHLISVAFQKGIIEAESEAVKRPAFVLDAFHDALIDHIIPELKKRGMMK
ncbi:MAG: hypothetical protein Q7R98_03290 [Candidatus Jorgensenbacteria bacterium]|nr:hypothetical protein [Candidatus Jorgensenbacteria bacterium]